MKKRGGCPRSNPRMKPKRAVYVSENLKLRQVRLGVVEVDGEQAFDSEHVSDPERIGG